MVLNFTAYTLCIDTQCVIIKPYLFIHSTPLNITDSMKPDLKTIIFTHHPCPDGLGAVVCLEKKFGRNATYIGLNHGRLEDMHHAIFSHLSENQAHLIFVDIAPPFDILKKILESPLYTVTILDHHLTAKSELERNYEFLKTFTDSTPPRLHLELDLKRSGVGIAYDYVNGEIKRPAYISLMQSIDLFTATSNTDIITDFCNEEIKLSEYSQELMKSLGYLAKNNDIETCINFYVFATIFDLQIKEFFKQSDNKLNIKLISLMKDYFESIEQNGIESLLEATFQDEKGEFKNVKDIFQSQLEYQRNALENAVIIPSLIDDKLDILFIDANMQSGRTFDPLIAQKLSKLSRPTIAMVVNTKNISDKNNWVSLRAESDRYNLCDITEQYKAKNLVENAGGHPRASALQFNRTQISKFLNLAVQSKLSADTYKTSSAANIIHYSFYLKCLTVLAGISLLVAGLFSLQPLVRNTSLGLIVIGGSLAIHSFFRTKPSPNSYTQNHIISSMKAPCVD